MKRTTETPISFTLKAVLPVVIVPVMITVAATLNGCSRSLGRASEASHPGQPLIAWFKRQHGSAQIEIVYNDISQSRSKLGARASWREIRNQVEQFLKTAPPGSKLEIWVTGRLAGRPQLVLEYERKRLRPSLIREKKRQILKQIEAVERRILTNPPYIPYSCVLEDSHRCALRALSLGQRKRVKGRVIIHSDLQQFSPTLKLPEILRGEKGALAARMLRRMPKLSAPLDWSIIFYPGTPGPQALTSAEEQKLQEFSRHLITHWGRSTCEIREPSDLGSTP